MSSSARGSEPDDPSAQVLRPNEPSTQGSETNEPSTQVSERREPPLEELAPDELIRRVREAEERNILLQVTNYDQYMIQCIQCFENKLAIGKDLRRCTRSNIPIRKDRPCMEKIIPWGGDFSDSMNKKLEILQHHFTSDKRYFPSKQSTMALGEVACETRIRHHKNLEIYHKIAIAFQTQIVISKLRKLSKKGSKVKFEESDNLIKADKVKGAGLERTGADQFVFERKKGSYRLFLVAEFKTPQTLMISNLKHGLKRADEENGMNVKDMINCPTIYAYRTRAAAPGKPDIIIPEFVDGESEGLPEPEESKGNEPEDSESEDSESEDSEPETEIPPECLLEEPKEITQAFVEKSEWLVVAALAQAYSYMIENGLEYGYIYTGEAFVFLRIPVKERSHIYYHLTEVKLDAEQNSVDIFLTPVTQLSCFCLMALESERRDQTSINTTVQESYHPIPNNIVVLKRMGSGTESDSSSPPMYEYSSGSEPVVTHGRNFGLRSKSVQEAQQTLGESAGPSNPPQTGASLPELHESTNSCLSSFATPKRKRSKETGGCRPPDTRPSNGPESPPDSPTGGFSGTSSNPGNSSKAGKSNTQAKSGKGKQRSGKKQKSYHDSSQPMPQECLDEIEDRNKMILQKIREEKVRVKNFRHRQYCTQACLLGLVRGDQFDEACPNVSEHRSNESNNRHPFDQKTLEKKMNDQLFDSLNIGCEPLEKVGARGVLFKLTLDSYGYTFVGKGTVKECIPYLEHEARVYRHLNALQGDVIPVFLGKVSLVHPYCIQYGRIKHFIMMSWAGEEAKKRLLCSLGKDIALETNLAVRKLQNYMVIHGDLRRPNILWNDESKKVMLVDFERSVILKPVLKQVAVLQEKSANQKWKISHHLKKEYFSISPLSRELCESA